IPKLCPGIVGATKKINWFFHALTVIAAGFAVFTLTHNRGMTLIIMALLSFNTGLMSAANSWYTESPATFFLLAHSVCLYGLFFQPRRMLNALGAGLSLGLLILTKNIFLYLLYLYIPVVIFLAIWRNKDAVPALLMCTAAIAVLGPWSVRNYMTTSS